MRKLEGSWMFPSIRRGIGVLSCLALLAHAAAALASPLEFRITFDPKVSTHPFTGRIYVMLSHEPVTEPRSGPNWFRPEPFFARDIEDWRPGEVAVLAGGALGYPTPLAQLPKGT